MLGNKIKEFRKKNGLSQTEMAKALNVAIGTISMWENDLRTPDLNTIREIAELFKIGVDELIGDAKKKGVKVPVLGVIPAGVPIEAITDILDYEEIPEEMARTGEFFALKVKGDSMSPNILPGDVVIFKKQESADSGAICAVMVNGYDATLKKVRWNEKGIMLIPLNPEYETMFYSNEEIISKPVKIIGKAVEIRRSL